MFNKYIFIQALILLCISLQLSAQQCNSCSNCVCRCANYVICPGDTYSGIASRYGTSVAALCAANPSVNPNNLQIG